MTAQLEFNKKMRFDFFCSFAYRFPSANRLNPKITKKQKHLPMTPNGKATTIKTTFSRETSVANEIKADPAIVSGLSHQCFRFSAVELHICFNRRRLPSEKKSNSNPPWTPSGHSN
jgi:hypothetical protein